MSRLRQLELWLAAGVLLVFPQAAQATVSGGSDAVLLALSGPGHRYATVLVTDVQEGCAHRPCDVYHVDLEAPAFRRLAPRQVQQATPDEALDERDLFDRYLAQLPPAQTALLAREHLPGSGIERLELEQREEVSAEVNGRRVEARLRKLWSAPSANAYDQHPDAGGMCVLAYQDRALCSACRKTVRWLDGAKTQTWECGDRGVRLEEPAEHEADASAGGESADGAKAAPRPCRCAARANLYVLELSDGRSKGHGSKILVEPFRTWQDSEARGKPGSWYDDTTLGFGPGSAGIQLLRTPKGTVIAVGSALHIPNGNTTHFPVFGWITPASH